MYEILHERCGLGSRSKVLEIGPGTGQATRQLLELGADPLVAVEPDPHLAEFLRFRFGTRIELVASTLEDAELEPESFDAAVAASSFHWVEEEPGLARISGALRPGGWAALWWTSFGDENNRDRFMLAVDPLFEEVPHGPSGPTEGRPGFARDAKRRLAALARAGFRECAHDEFRWPHEWDASGIRALYSTFSPIISLDLVRREELLDAVERIAQNDFGDRVEKPLITSLYTARKPA